VDSTLTIAGNVARGPELRQTASGKSAVGLTIAVNKRRYNQDTKQWEDGDATFIDASAFDTLADNIAASISTGDRVIVNGSIRQDNWVDKESGTNRSKLVMVIDEIGPSLKFGTTQFSKGGGGSRQAQQNTTEDSWASSGIDTQTPW